MADPQLRCLLCDLILADESTAGKPTEKCRQPGCGRMILAGQIQVEPQAEVLELEAPARPQRPVDLESLPVAGVVPPNRDRMSATDDVPVAHVIPKPPPLPTEVPTVQPRPRPAPRPSTLPAPRKVTLPEPRTTPPAKPQIITALGVLGCMTLLIILCIAVIAYSLLYGLQKARKAKSEAPRSVPAFVHVAE